MGLIYHVGLIQSDWIDPVPEKTIPSLLFTDFHGLIRDSKLGKKEQEWMADFPSRDVMLAGPSFFLVSFRSVFSGKGAE